jgi:phenylpyruvate tautomerase PptA (4-oxalocrotonate tautomerase family)
VPLIHIHLVEGRTPEQVQVLADTVHAAVLSAFPVPERDRYQIVHQHRAGELIVQDSGLGIDRSPSVVVVEVVSRKRTVAEKKTLYGLLGDNLHRDCGLDPSDLVVTVIENGDSDWSFAHGRAQFLTGELS